MAVVESATAPKLIQLTILIACVRLLLLKYFKAI